MVGGGETMSVEVNSYDLKRSTTGDYNIDVFPYWWYPYCQCWVICPHCGGSIESGDRFCRYCGKEVNAKHCPHCGKEL